MSFEVDVELVKENADGSAVYQFDFPPEALAALTRLGIMTALQAGFENARKFAPDYVDDEDVSATQVYNEVMVEDNS